MPWSETTKMRERMRFVLDAEEKLFSMTELCGSSPDADAATSLAPAIL